MNNDFRKYLTNKLVGLVKFCAIVGVLCLIVIKAPEQAGQIVGLAAAFVLGGSTDIRSKLGL